MIICIICIISILLDGLLTNYLPYLVNDLSLFTPLFTVTSIFLLFPFYRKNSKEYLIHMFLLGILYDLFHTNLLFLDGILFLGIAYLSKIIYQNFEVSYLRVLIYIPILIFFYESFFALILFLFQIVPITVEGVFYKITHSILINLIYGEILLIIIRIIPKKFKKININE